MEKVVTYNLNEDFTGSVADFLRENFPDNGAGTDRLAFVFEGKRPALFLRKALANKIRKSFLSPAFFSIEEFVEYTLMKDAPFVKMPGMESWYTIYTLARDIAPGIVEGRESFSQFLPWAREIANFIDLLDIEDIPDDDLKSVQAKADIGYEIPANINASLQNIVALRNAYHEELRSKNSFSKGFIYRSAAEAVEEVDFSEFDRIFFCGFFYMQKTERRIIKHLYDSDRATLFFQGDEDNWSVLKELSGYFSCRIKPKKESSDRYRLKLYSAFDRHSQVCTVREILKDGEKPGSTVIVLPDAESMIPLISELGDSVGDFNVSLGYPLRRSSLYSLFELIVRAQKTRRGGQYRAADYIRALSQPLAKNLEISEKYSATRVLVHKVEEALLGIEKGSISKRFFVTLEEIENETAVFKSACGTLKRMNIPVTVQDLKGVLKELHKLVFTMWEDVRNFGDFAVSLRAFLDTLVKKRFVDRYPVNRKIAERLYSIADELKDSPFSNEDFEKEDIFKIFETMIENEAVSFKGSPLRGMQMMGVLETRCLNFENVIVMDANEGKLPQLHIHDPLIPNDITLSFGLDRIEKDEQTQRYLFTRILASAKNVHLVYEENREKEKSRFVENLLWQRQKREQRIDVVPIQQASFSAKVMPERAGVEKTGKIVDYLKRHRYSPSSMDIYMKCPLRFYYRYVLGLREKEELAEEIENVDVGTFIHDLLEAAFRRFIGRKPEINKEFRRDFLKMFDERFNREFSKRMRSDSYLVRDVMKKRLERFLEVESARVEKEVRKILLLEEEKKEEVEFSGDIFSMTYKTDRVEELEDGAVLILDYKTGSSLPKPAKIKKLREMEFNRESIKRNIQSFQLPLYYYLEKQKREDQDMQAAFYNLRGIELEYFPGDEEYLEETIGICISAIDFILHEIVNPEKGFEADREEERYCEHCPFSCMCG